MSPINLKIGDGFQYHIESTSEGYGFMKVIIREDNPSFLIESPYTKMEKGNKVGTTVPQSFIWRIKKMST